MESTKEMQTTSQVGSYGFINKKKKAYLKRVFIYAAAGIAIFMLGLCLNKFNKANIFTILAVLMVLPGAKAATEYILFAKHKSVEASRYKTVYEALTTNLTSTHSLEEVMQTTSVIDQKVTLFADVVCTSKEKVMNLDFVILTEKGVYCLVGKLGQDQAYILKFIKEIMKEHHAYPEVKVTDNLEKFLSYARQVGVKESEDLGNNVKVVGTMEIYIVK